MQAFGILMIVGTLGAYLWLLVGHPREADRWLLAVLPIVVLLLELLRPGFPNATRDSPTPSAIEGRGLDHRRPRSLGRHSSFDDDGPLPLTNRVRVDPTP